MKNRIFLSIIIGLILIALSACTKTEPFDYDEAESIEIINLNETDILNVDNDYLELIALIMPSGALQDVSWFSSDDEIASVNSKGEVNGLKAGIVTITAKVTENPEIFNSIIITVIDTTSELLTIAGIINMLDEAIPYEVTTNLNFPTIIDQARLTWESSDYYVINRNGIVKQAPSDKYINLKAKIKLPHTEGVFTKTVMVKAYNLKNMNKGKTIFTYLYDPNFTNFHEGDLEKIDVINYSFGGIRNNKVSVGGLTKIDTIIPQAHAAGVRVVLAIGGWGVDGFSQACRDAASRTIFIASIMEAIENYRFDGIDIDWEYPTQTAGGLIVSNPNDKANLTLFMQELRTAMNKVNPDLILSMAVAAGTYAANSYYDIYALKDIINYLHIMSYDMIDYTNFISTHHTNLYPSSYANFSISQAVDTYHSKGLAKTKIIVGVAFYGHVFFTTSPGTNGIRASTDSSKRTTIRHQALKENYLNNSEYTVFTDDVAKANWLYGKNTFITYDSPYSISHKGQYVIDNGLGGLMVWEYCQDAHDSTLLKAMYESLNQN